MILFFTSCLFSAPTLKADAFPRAVTTWTRSLTCISTGPSSLPAANRTGYGTFTAAFWTWNRCCFLCHLLPPFIFSTKTPIGSVRYGHGIFDFFNSLFTLDIPYATGLCGCAVPNVVFLHSPAACTGDSPSLCSRANASTPVRSRSGRRIPP